MQYAQEKIVPYGSKEGKRNAVMQMFNSIAPTYDRYNHAMSLGIDRWWRHKAIKVLQTCGAKEVLDVATGTGDLALLAAKVLPEARITGIDISDGMMAVGREKALKMGLLGRVTFANEDCTNLSYASESYDAVISSFGIRNFEALDKGFGEMFRVLRPNGKLIVLELSRPRFAPVKQLFDFYSHTLMPLVGRLMAGDRKAYTYLPDSIEAFPQGEVICESLRNIGFKQASCERLTFGICTLFVATK